MEELQSWWEVPTIAHFCYVFRAAFNLFHFEIEELEAALLQEKHGEQPCVTVEQLAMRLLQGCCKKKTLNVENWEDVLRLHLQDDSSKAKQHSTLLISEKSFSSLQLRDKVEILLSLCEMRLDADDVLDAIKGIESDSLRIEPIGSDSGGNVYWYFFGIRLYKEDIKGKKLLKEKKPNSRSKIQKSGPKSSGAANKTVINGHRRSSRVSKKGPENTSSLVWSIVCHTFEEWEKLSTSLCKSRISCDQALGRKIKKQYIPMLYEVLAERERLKRRRLIELAPRRTSARIDKVRQQELAVAEQARLKLLAEEEEKQRKELLESSAKREAEKHRAIEERAKRAKLREMRMQESENSNSCDTYSGISDDHPQFLLSSGTGIQHNSVASWTDGYSSGMEHEENNARSESDNSTGDDDDDDDSDDISEVESEEDSGSDVSYKLYMPSSQKCKAKSLQKCSPVQYKIPREETKAMPLQSDLSNSFNARGFQKHVGLELGAKGIKASITYHNYKSYSVAKASPLYPKTQGENAEQITQSTLTHTPTVITLGLLRDKMKKHHSIT